MNYPCIRALIIGLLLAASGAEVCAQRIPAWTRRLTPATWQQLTRATRFFPNGRAPFITFPQVLTLTPTVRTTDRKFIYHHIFYSDVFSKAEKEILLKPVYEQATLGKISYLHDKHAAFFNIISQTAPQAINEDAFWKHQNVLEKMLSGLETHYLIANRKRFASSVFSETEIAHMQTPVLQPPAYMLHVGELRYFADLPSLDAQRKWVADTITYIQADIQALLTKDTTSLQLNEFERYYTQNIRLHYFKSLAGVLAAQRNGKRPSAIIRLRMAVPQGNFGTQKLTDAQRAGYLQFINDTQGTITTNELKNFNETYGHYAVAEALKAPYEIALQYSMYAPELLGMEEGTRLRQLSPEDCLQELLPQINTLEAQLINLRQHALHTREFYGSYYQLHAKQQIYKTLTARAQTMLNWKHD